MRKKCAAGIFGVFLFLISIQSFAQIAKTVMIEPYRLAISFTKTTNLIFPYGIKSIDKGSLDVLAQKAIGVENILQLKASKEDFPETNLTVVTADGSMFSYLLNYAENPGNINIKMENDQLNSEALAVFTNDATNDIIRGNAEKVATKRKSAKRIRDEDHATSIDLKGLYIQEGVLYFQFDLRNYSALNYDVKMLRFFIKDRKKSKRTASQELEIDPLFILGNTDVIRASSEQTVVVAVPKFTIPDKKIFIVQVQEKHGGRNLELHIRNKTVFSAGNIK